MTVVRSIEQTKFIEARAVGEVAQGGGPISGSARLPDRRPSQKFARPNRTFGFN
jgi:hypothetical protein